MGSTMDITKENIRNIDALWKWIKKECERGNVENLKLETIIEDIPADIPFNKRVKRRILTIELGPKGEY